MALLNYRFPTREIPFHQPPRSSYSNRSFAGPSSPAKGGLGLGLYIASEIAKVHGGTLTVASSPDETRFTLRMPLI
jgi:signal transduction histidine kinase